MDTSSLHGGQKIYLSFIQNKEDRTFVFQLIKILWTHNLSRDIPISSSILLVGLPAYHSINSSYFSTLNEAKKLYKKISESKVADAPFNLYNLLKAPSIIKNCLDDICCYYAIHIYADES